MGTVHSRGKKHRIYVYFQYLGARRHEKTSFFCETGKKGCKCRQCKSAAGWLHEIECKIEDNVFNFSEYFPDSKNTKTMLMSESSPSISFGTYATLWLESQKTLKNHVGVLSSILTAALEDDLIPKNPCTSVKLPHLSSIEVEPFSLAEIEMILSWMKENHPAMLAFFAISFFSGMRTGEVMGLKWNDMDFNNHTITVRRTITASKIKERTKTGESRTVDILTELDEYLAFHKQFTFMKSEWLFLTYEDKPFHKTDNIIKTYWRPCLKALGIKYRTLYQTRHSFACLMLDLGENINWIKMMLGHKTLDMIMRRYGNRIVKTEGRKGGKMKSAISSTIKIEVSK